MLILSFSLTCNTWVREAFQMADKNKDGALDFEEILKLLNTLNADIGKKYAREMFDVSISVTYQ